jgi:prefoldin subunit 5
MMRQDRFTEGAQEVLAASQEMVRKERHSQWDVEHVLLSLLTLERGVMPQLWEKLNIDRNALLGAGWADAERGDYEAALAPWLRLNKLGSKQPAALEVRLAVPYSFAQLGDRDRAIYFYEQAISYYDTEQADLDAAIQAAESGALLTLLGQADTHESGGWLHDIPTLKDIPSGRYLVDVLAKHAFQENLKDYRDLGFLQELLTGRLANIELLNDMVDARRLAYKSRAPGIRAQLEQQRAQAAHTHWQTLDAKLKAQVQGNDPLGLATGKEKQQLATLDKVEHTLARLPDGHKRKSALQDKGRWLRGILYWQIQSDYPARLWEVRKQLQQLEQPVKELLVKHQTIEQALENVPDSFSGYDQRIEALRQRILSLLPAIQEARDEAGQQIYQLAMQELGARRERLISYRAQARYALARSYDQLAGQQDTEARP